MHRKYVTSNGRRLGPYYYATMRDANGGTKSYYLGRDKAEAKRKEAELKGRLGKKARKKKPFPRWPFAIIALSLLIVAASAFTQQPSFTGTAVLEGIAETAFAAQEEALEPLESPVIAEADIPEAPADVTENQTEPAQEPPAAQPEGIPAPSAEAPASDLPEPQPEPFPEPAPEALPQEHDMPAAILGRSGTEMPSDVSYKDPETGEVLYSVQYAEPPPAGGPSMSPPAPKGAQKIKDGTYDVSLSPKGHPVKSIDMKDVEVSGSSSHLVRLDDVPEFGDYVEVYAIDPTAIKFNSATVKATAKGIRLYKCKDWDFDGQACHGEWAYMQDISPGKDYSFELTPEDPAFAEAGPDSILECTEGGSAGTCNLVYIQVDDTSYEQFRVGKGAVLNRLNTSHNATLPIGAIITNLTVCILAYRDSILGDDAGDSCAIYAGENATGAPTYTTAVAPSQAVCQQWSSTTGNPTMVCGEVTSWINSKPDPSLSAQKMIISFVGVEQGDNNVDLWIDWMYTNITYNVDARAPAWYSQGQNSTSIHQADSVKLYAYWTDDANLSQAILETNESGVWENKTAYGSPLTFTSNESWSNFTWQNSSVQPGQAVGWRIWANDSSNKFNVTGTMSFLVTGDTTPPSVTLVSPANGTNHTTGNVSFTCNATDDCGLSNITLHVWNSTGAYYSNTKGVSGQSNQSSWNLTGIADGEYEWNCLASDSANYYNWSDQNRTFTADQTGPEVFDLRPPQGSAYYSNTTNALEISANATDSIAGVDTVTASIAYPNGTAALLQLARAGATYKYNASFTIPPLKGQYNITFTANDTLGNPNGTEKTHFTLIDNTPPGVTILYPLGENLDENKAVPITVDAYDLSGVDKILANITIPNGTSYLLDGFSTGLQSDDFSTDTEGVNWVHSNITAAGQYCYTDIDGTVPGKMFFAVDGGSGPATAHCAYNSLRRVDGNYDLNLTFNISLIDDDAFFTLRSAPTDSLEAMRIMVHISVIKQSGQINYRFTYYNGSATVQQNIPTSDTYGRLRIKRYNMTGTPVFNMYYWNNTGGYWLGVFGNISLPGSARTQYIQLKPGSEASQFGRINVTVDDFQISGDNYTFALCNQTNVGGIYNVTVIANDTLGYVNSTEKTYFNISEVNDPPSRPYIESPDVGERVYGLFNISWGHVFEEEGDSLQFNITLLNPDNGTNATIVSDYGNANTTYYEWNTSAYPSGTYGLKVVAFENETAEKLTSEDSLGGNITINQEIPGVIIIYPRGESYDEDSYVSIQTNITEPDGLNLRVAQVTMPNSTSINTSLYQSPQRDTFEANTMGFVWSIENGSLGPNQTCIVNINGTVPGKAFTSISGDGSPGTDTYCSMVLNYAAVGDFDMNVSFNTEGYTGNDNALNLILAERPSSISPGDQIFMALSNWTGHEKSYEIFADVGNTSEYIAARATNDSSGKFRVKRAGDNFTFYTWNNTAGSWHEESVSQSVFEMNPGLSIILESESAYPGWGSMNVSWDDVETGIPASLWSSRFDYASLSGTYNVTVYARDSLGAMNSSEMANFTVVFTNDAPTAPYMLSPAPNSFVSGIHGITWSGVNDEEGDSLQFNITLLNPNSSFNSTIASNYGSASTTSYQWNTSLFPDGLYSLRVDAFENETAEKLSSYNVLTGNFTIDNTAPQILFAPPTENSGIAASRSWIAANATITEANLKNFTYSLHGASLLNSTTYTSYPSSVNWTGLADGLYRYNITAYDEASNYNCTETRNMTLDTAPPAIALNFPPPGHNTSLAYMDFSWTAADGLGSSMACNLTLDGAVNASQIVSANGTPANYTVYGIPGGAHYWNVTCRDEAGNSNASATRGFTIDNVPPYYINDQDDSSSPVPQGYPVEVSALWQDATAPETAIFRTNQTGSWENTSYCMLSGTGGYCNDTIDTTGKAGKTICWNQYANDTLGNWNTTMPYHCFSVAPNMPPNTTTPAIYPAAAYTNDALYCSATLTDPEQTSLTAYWTWHNGSSPYLSGSTAVPNGTAANITVLAPGNTTKGETWTCQVTPNDGGENGTAYNSTGRLVLNTPPSIANVDVTPDAAYAANDLTCAVSGWSDADLDSQQYHYKWYNGTSLMFTYLLSSASSVLGSGNTTDNETWNCTVTPYDGEENGTALSDSVTVLAVGGDTTPPSVTSYSVEPYDPTVGYNVSLNASASDDIAVSGIFANVTLPNSTVMMFQMPCNCTVQLPGRHNVTFWANDTSGNTGSQQAYFIAGNAPVPVQFNAVDSNLSGITVNLTIYFQGTQQEVQLSEFTGSLTDNHTDVLYDLYYTALNGNATVRLNGVNLSVDYNRTLGLDKTAAPDFLVTYGINSTYSITGAILVLSYSGSGYTNEDYLGIYRCAAWNFTSRSCNGTWESVSGAQDKNADTFTASASGFSAYSIKQESVPSPPPAGQPSGGGGGFVTTCNTSWSCGEWGPCMPSGIQERPCTDLNRCVPNRTESRACAYRPPAVPEAPENCSDGIRNQDETGIDCGGVCGPTCRDGQPCLTDGDCINSCNLVTGICHTPAEPAPSLLERLYEILWKERFLVTVFSSVVVFVAALFVLYRRKRAPWLPYRALAAFAVISTLSYLWVRSRKKREISKNRVLIQLIDKGGKKKELLRYDAKGKVSVMGRRLKRRK